MRKKTTGERTQKLRGNAQQILSLRQKFRGLTHKAGGRNAPEEGLAHTLFGDMIDRLSLLLGGEFAVLVSDNGQGRFKGLCLPGRGEEPSGIVAQECVVRDLLAGKRYVSAETGQEFFFSIMAGKKLEGILKIGERDLSESDRELVAAVCRQTALEIENRRLRQELYATFDRLSAISSVIRSLSSIHDYETLLRTILDLSAVLLEAEQGSLMILDHGADALILEAKKGGDDVTAVRLRINRGQGIAGGVAERGEALLVANVEDDPRVMQKNRGHYRTPSFVSVPLKVDDRIIGVINLADKTTGEVFDEEDLQLLQSFATHAAVVLERNAFLRKTEELKKLNITDCVTGLVNRRHLQECLENELARSERNDHKFCVLMLDLDGFKLCNDTFGHPFGDKMLKIIADTLLSAVRSMDTVARYGGDEFIILLPETDEALAFDIAERIRSRMSTNIVVLPDVAQGNSFVLTASIGLVFYPRHGNTVEGLLENVDKALYRAKTKGRNRIEVCR